MGAGHHRTLRLAAAASALALLAGCGGGGGGAASPAAPVEAPVEVTNRWALVDPAGEGVDAPALARADRHARDRSPNVTSLLVARHGRLVFEGYYHGAAPTDRAPVHSITKSVTSALVGIAVRDGKLALDRPVLDYLPHVAPLVIDERARRITLRHLLTMSAGWVVKGSIATGGGLDALRDPDPAAAAFRRPLLAAPGEKFGYDSASSHLLSLAVARAMGTPTADLAQRELFGPSGFRARSGRRTRTGQRSARSASTSVRASWRSWASCFCNVAAGGASSCFPNATSPRPRGPRSRSGSLTRATAISSGSARARPGTTPPSATAGRA